MTSRGLKLKSKETTKPIEPPPLTLKTLREQIERANANKKNKKGRRAKLLKKKKKKEVVPFVIPDHLHSKIKLYEKHPV